MKSNRRIFWIIVVLVLVIDRITKELAFGIPAEGITIIPGVLGLRYAENVGAAFSMLSGAPRLLGVLSLVLIVGGFIWLRKKTFRTPALTGLALMAGGAAGNMFDRLIRGFVPDMIETRFMNFPVFNAADVCICLGAALAVIGAAPGSREQTGGGKRR